MKAMMDAGAAAFEQLAAIAQDLQVERLSAEALALAERAREGSFYVACVGQFKRGKSSLLNALVGQAVLPTGLLPLTALPTVVRDGQPARARVRTAQGWMEIPPADLAAYVTEAGNPGNRRGVEAAEVFVPSPLLASGLCLIDTPGLGSVFATNTAAVREFLPQMDAALVVLGADPPLAGEELDLVAEIARQTEDVIAVMNKADRHEPEERAEACAFALRVLEERLGRPLPPILQVSAHEANAGRSGYDWSRLVETVSRLAGRRQRLVGAAVERGRRRIAQRLSALAAAEEAELWRPLEEAESRRAALGETTRRAEGWLADLGARLAAEQQRLRQRLDHHRREFAPPLRARAQAGLTQELAALPRAPGPAYRRAAMAAAQRVARREIRPALEAEQARGEAAFRAMSERFREESQEFLAACARAGLEMGSEDLDTELRQPSRFYFCEFGSLAEPASPLRWAADAALAGVGLRSRLDAAARRFLDLLLDTNCRRIQSDVEERVSQGRRQLEAELRNVLGEVAASAALASQRATEVRRQGEAATAARREQLAEQMRALQKLAGTDTGLGGSLSGGCR